MWVCRNRARATRRCMDYSKVTPFFSGLSLFSIFTDRKPLIPLLNLRQLDEIENPRLQQLRMKNPRVFIHSLVGQGNNQHRTRYPITCARVAMPTPDDELGKDQDVAFIHNITTSNVHSIDINLRLDAVRGLLLTLTMRTSCCSTQCGPAFQTQKPNSSSLAIRTGLCVTACQLMTALLSTAAD